MTIKDADKFIAKHHRHNRVAKNGKFAIGCYVGEELIGVGIGGRPRAAALDNGMTFEVYRVCTNGYKNATSFIYSKMKKIAQQMGYLKIITYTLQTESGSSLKAIGAVIEKSVTHKKQWNDSGGVKRNPHPVSIQLKFRWTL